MAHIFVKTFEIGVRTGMFRFDTQIRLRKDISASVTNSIVSSPFPFPFSKLFYSTEKSIAGACLRILKEYKPVSQV